MYIYVCIIIYASGNGNQNGHMDGREFLWLRLAAMRLAQVVPSKHKGPASGKGQLYYIWFLCGKR